jgi:multimeric flavodoxin WrbA
MHILTLLGSPRRHGNTDAVLRRFETAAAVRGHAVTRIDIADHHVAGCLGCEACQGDLTDPGCVQTDDGDEILRQIQAADLTIYAAPVYCWSFPAQMKALIDRHFCTVKWADGQVAVSLLAGKRTALLLTCGDAAATNADLALLMFQRQMSYTRCNIGGTYVLDNCTRPLADALRADALVQRMVAELLDA